MASLIVGALPMIPQTVGLRSPLSSSQSETLGVPLRRSAASLSISAASSPPSPFVDCGRGDRKTARGKRFNHSFGNARPRDKKKGRGPPRLAVPPSPPKKDRSDDDALVKIEIDESLFSG